MSRKQKIPNAAVIYARFSPRKNAAKCESCDAQVEACRKYAELYGLEIIGEYRDEAKSGKTDSRAGFKKAMAVTIANNATMIVRDMSRFGRNTLQVLSNAEKLWAGGAGFAAINERFDTTTAVGRFSFRIKAAVDELEREQIAERTKAAMLRKQANGQRMSSKLPYGMCDDPDDPARMVPDPEEQENIERVVALHRAGHSSREIATEMNLEGRKIRGKDWYHQAVPRILRREGVIK